MRFQVLALVAALGLAAPAHADLIAGFDFSQYAGDGLLSIDGATLQNTLPANYSDLDPTNGAGAESAAFGTLFFDGTFGSTNIIPTGADPFVPSTVFGNLVSNANLPGTVPFGSDTVVQSEGQLFAIPAAMTATDLVSVVFAADLSSTNLVGSNFVLDFAARTFAGTAQIGVEFSTDGMTFFDLGPVDIDANDTAFSVALGGMSATQGIVRLTLGGAQQPGGIGQPFIDNVGISADLAPNVPEPATAALLLFGLGAVAFTRRKRS